MYRTKLVKEGFISLDAPDGESGLASALKEHPDLILLDVKMPKLDGMEVMTALRADAWGASVPIILISNFDTSDQDLKDISDARPAFYVLKRNYTLDDVIDKIREVFRTK
jgi:DNA-binding response OmpR family regulator